MAGLYEDKYSYMIITSPYIMPVKKIEIPHKTETTPAIEKPTVHNSIEIISTDNIKNFITKNLVYPTLELENNVEGAVFIILDSDSFPLPFADQMRNLIFLLFLLVVAGEE